RIPHANDDALDTARCDRPRARGGASMERARLEGRVERRGADVDATILGAARGSYLCVILARSLRVATREHGPVVVDDHAGDPRVVTRRAARALRLGDSKAHEHFVIERHPTG